MKKLRSLYGYVQKRTVEGWARYCKALSFDILYGLVPFLIFAAAVANLFGVPELLYDAVKKFLLPGAITEKILEYLYYLSDFDASGLAVMGLALSVTAFSRASMQIMDFADRKTRCRRPMWKRWLLSAGMSVLFLVTTLALMVLIVLGNRIIAALPVRSANTPVITLARYAAAGGMLLLFLMLLYRFAPTVAIPLRRCLPLALMSMTGVLVSSGLFSLYMDNFHRISWLYGSLAAFVVLLLWVHLLSRILLLGFALNADGKKDEKH